MHAIESVCRAHHGIISAGALAANGFGRSQVVAAVRAGLLERSSRGYYCLPDAPCELRLAASLGASLTCVSAARALGWWVLRPPDLPHLRADKLVDTPGIHLHRGSRNASRVVATPVQIVADACRCLPPLEALVIAESAVVHNAVSPTSLRESFDGERDWQIRALLADVSRRTASPLEVCARYHLRAAGFEVECEVLVSGVGRVDFLVEGRLIVEIDGYEFHSSRRHYRQDRGRWNSAMAQGLMTLRITAEMVLSSPEEFIRLVRSALAG